MSSASPSRNSQSAGALFEGWLYHVGTTCLGYQVCRSRYLIIRGKYVALYSCDPRTRHQKPMQRGILGRSMMVEDLGCQKFRGRALYVLRIYSLLDFSKQGKLACSSAAEAQKCFSAFQYAKREALSENVRCHAIMEAQEEFRFNTGSSCYRRYSFFKLLPYGLAKNIGKDPELLSLHPSMVAQDPDCMDDGVLNGEVCRKDSIEKIKWKCIMIVNGLRIFEELERVKKGRKEYKYMKSVGVVEAAPDQVFELIMSLSRDQRQQWDVFTGDLKLVDNVDGHTDIVQGFYDSKLFERWSCKRDFKILRQWRHDQHGSFCITEQSLNYRNHTGKFPHSQVKLNSTVWEISLLPRKYGSLKSLVTQMIKIQLPGSKLLQNLLHTKLQKKITFALLCRTAGIKEFFAANPWGADLESDASADVYKSDGENGLQTIQKTLITENNEQFYDALSLDDLSSENNDGEPEVQFMRNGKVDLLVRNSDSTSRVALARKWPLLRQGHGKTDFNCWTDPGCQDFMVRGKTYMQDGLKVPSGPPLLNLLGVDWLSNEKRMDRIASHPGCLIQSHETRKLPFVLVFNFQLPGTPNYSLVSYFGSHTPIRPGSLLHSFITGDDTYRNSRLKFISRIVDGHWIAKRLVRNKPILLGRMLTCRYYVSENFLEIDVDVGSSSVACGTSNVLLNCSSTVVIDLVLLIEGRDETELPEQLLGVARIHRVNAELATRIEMIQ
ncbi:hypothetical protein KP509_37G065600 [Ceratopteris richardii]|uniref:START domain-containing protein n=1 Tax=Ceratopteris richardii TaxID=49495 RepID=A0A8T2Q9G9_CERRI|nr:hypothetical protein KP509_37G065600 [Ceratopteris richardii]